MYTCAGSELRLENGKTVTFLYPIKECQTTDEVIVVVLNVPPNVRVTENVYGVSPGGQILWQIERTPLMGTDGADRFVRVTPGDAGRVWVTNWNGYAAEVDVRSGKILSTEFVH